MVRERTAARHAADLPRAPLLRDRRECQMCSESSSRLQLARRRSGMARARTNRETRQRL